LCHCLSYIHTFRLYFIWMADRKARLAALAARAGRGSIPDAPLEEANEPGETVIPEEPTLAPEMALTDPAVSLRNYKPVDKSLPLGESEPASKRAKPDSSDTNNALQQALVKARAEASLATVANTEYIASVAPRKINDDLKRDIQPKLDKLERRTHKAIVELLKARLEQEAAAEEID
jgi:coiled-coil domain-containing protein 12